MDSVDTSQTNQKHSKGYKGIGMEGPVARWYAKNTAKALGEFQQCAHEIARQLPEGSRVLEIAPGPGYLAIELAKLGRYQISGLDISRTFVGIAREKVEPRLSRSTFSKVTWRMCRTKVTYSISLFAARRLRIFPIPLEP